MSTLKFKSMAAFDKHLEKLVSEGLEKAKNSLFEAPPPAPPAAQPPVAAPSPAAATPAPAAAPAAISLNGSTNGAPTEDQPEELTVFTIIDQLNIIRSGQSLKDKELSEQMHTYFESLTPEEQQQLYKYLQGISAIVNPPNDAAAAPDPNQPGMALNSPPPGPTPAAPVPNAPSAPAPAPAPAATPAPKKAPHPPAPRPQEDPELPIRVKRNVP